MRNRRYYLDTSVWGGFFDEEFEADSDSLFKMINNGLVVCLHSRVVRDELVGAPENVRTFFASVPDEQKEELEITPEVTLLANTYISEKVVGRTSYRDCLHIAAATIYKADILFSWNLRHIVNEPRIVDYNDINVRFGYSVLDIRKPKMVEIL